MGLSSVSVGAMFQDSKHQKSLYFMQFQFELLTGAMDQSVLHQKPQYQ
jgi:hypothetical protein